MNKREYMEKLLSLCTEKQRDLFNRMYPDGVNIKKLDWAITQLENTLKNLNTTKEDLAGARKDFAEKVEDFEEKIGLLNRQVKIKDKEINQLYLRIDRLSNTVDIENADIQERLDLLDKLQAGGVDNWDGYDYAVFGE